MIKLFNEKFQYNDIGIGIRQEFNELVSPFFEKYKTKVNPVEFEALVNASINLFLTKNNIETALEIHKNEK